MESKSHQNAVVDNENNDMPFKGAPSFFVHVPEFSQKY